MQFQLVLTYMHQSNAEEQAVITFKNHCIVSLFTVYPPFHFCIWGRLLPQSIMKMKILRLSWINYVLSSYEQVDTSYTILSMYHYHHWYLKWKFMENHASNTHTLPTHYMDGILEWHSIIKYDTTATILIQAEIPHRIQYISFQNLWKFPTSVLETRSFMLCRSGKVLAKTTSRITLTDWLLSTQTNKGIIQTFLCNNSTPKQGYTPHPPNPLKIYIFKLPRVKYETSLPPIVDPD